MKHYWYFDAGQFAIIDETGTAIDPSRSIEIKYQKRAVGKIKNVDEFAPAKAYKIEPAGTTHADLKGKQCVVIKAIPITDGEDSQIDVGTILYVGSDAVVNYIVDEDFNITGTATYAPIGTISTQTDPYYLIDVNDTWDYQDDGYAEDVQLTAMYYAASMAADIVPEGRELVKGLFDRYRYRMKDLQIKLHSSKFSDITIKPNHF